MRLKHFLSILVLLSAAVLNAQTKVEITGGERMYGDQIKKHLYIVNNVVIRHGGVVIQCDSAIRKTEEGIIEGFGHIYIYQPDTFTLSGGEYLRYDEESKTAIVSGPSVVLRDQQMTLTTSAIQYNTQNQVGFYTNGADIISDRNHLWSRRGYYSRRGNVFNFKDNVKLTSPEYTMSSDTLDYYASSKTAYFQGPTEIISKENRITCRYGWYNTRTEKAQFSKGATLYSDSGFISADSLLYDRKSGIGTGIGSIRVFDSAEHIDIYGQYGRHYQKSKTSVVSGFPLAIHTAGKDTLYVMADTFHIRNDSLKRSMRAFRNTSILEKEFQGHCDSLVYDFSDSAIRLYHSPILWNASNQITGDSMRIDIRNNSIQTLRVEGSAFLASEVKPSYYNQISGREMLNRFDSNRLVSVLVDGNAQSIYYLRDNETDTAEYSGVNKVACGKMLIGFDSSKVKAIRFYAQPEGKLYPLKEFPDGEKYLAGLDWKPLQRPVLNSFLLRKNMKRTVVPVPAAPKPVKPSKKDRKKRR